MRGIVKKELEELESTVAARVRVLENGCPAIGIDDLPKRWKSVITRRILLRKNVNINNLKIYFRIYLIGYIIYRMTLVHV